MANIRIRRKSNLFLLALLLAALFSIFCLFSHAEASDTHSHASSSGELCPKCGKTVTVTHYQPTCSAQGYTEYVCLECNEYRKLDDYVDKLAHSWEQIASSKATCTESGSITRKCKVCGEVSEVENGAALGHNYTDTVVEPTCSSIGYTLHTCSRCKHSYQDAETAKTDAHTYHEEIVEPPTCQTVGRRRDVCTVCGEVQNVELPIVDHEYTTQIIEPTHTEQGYTIYTCQFCQTVKRENYTDPKPYDMIWTTQEPTCTEGGQKVGICADGCGHIETVVLPRLGHEFSEWETIREATDTVVGLESHICSRCEMVETRTTSYASANVTTEEPAHLSPLTVMIVAFLLIISFGVIVLLFLLLLEHSRRDRQRDHRRRTRRSRG